MDKGILTIAILTLICAVVQMLPIISVPLTSPSRHLYLSKFNQYAFGVFGICDLTSGHCSTPRVGYPSKDNDFYNTTNHSDMGVNGIELPSQATYTISKLLVVHAISFGVAGIQFFLAIFVLSMEWLMKRKQDFDKEVVKPMLRGTKKPQKLGLKHDKERKDLSPYLDCMLFLSLTSFLSTLLAFLADILLFINNLTWLGWIQLLPLMVLTFITTTICFAKRGISTRRYLEDDNTYENDDMKMKKNSVINRLNDDGSDDGFFVYTKGFFSTTGNNETQDFENGWVHHNYHHNDEASIDSHENIPLEIIHRDSHDDGDDLYSTYDPNDQQSFIRPRS